MKNYIKEELREFFKEFWSKQPKNNKRVDGNVSRMSGYVATEQEFEERCKELGMPRPEFIMSSV